jgi:hypothetical protein
MVQRGVRSNPAGGNALNNLVALATSAKLPGPLLLAVWGVYSGQYAKLFKPPFDDYASEICLVAMIVGAGLVIIASLKSIFSSA